MDNIAYQCNRNPLWLQIYIPALQSLPYRRDGGVVASSFVAQSSLHTHIHMYIYI